MPTQPDIGIGATGPQAEIYPQKQEQPTIGVMQPQMQQNATTTNNITVIQQETTSAPAAKIAYSEEGIKCCFCLPMRCALITLLVFEILGLLSYLVNIIGIIAFDVSAYLNVALIVFLAILMLASFAIGIYMIVFWSKYVCNTSGPNDQRDTSLMRANVMKGFNAMLARAYLTAFIRFIIMFVGKMYVTPIWAMRS